MPAEQNFTPQLVIKKKMAGVSVLIPNIYWKNENSRWKTRLIGPIGVNVKEMKSESIKWTPLAEFGIVNDSFLNNPLAVVGF